MKIEWNAKSRLPEIKMEEVDFINAVHIQDMINGHFICKSCGTSTENNGWKVLMGYLQSQRLLLEKKIHASIETTLEDGRSRIQIAKLVGFDHFMSLADKVITQAEQMKADLQEQSKEKPTHEQNDYGD